jgi:signal transduction histidine kinase
MVWKIKGNPPLAELRLPAATAAATAAIFAGDVLTPPDCEVSGLYLLIVLMAGRFMRGGKLVAACAGCSALALTAQAIDHGLFAVRGQLAEIESFNTVVSLIAIWLAGYLVVRNQAAEAAADRARADLTRAARAMTMGELAATVAHEVSQPIAGAVTNASACLRWLSAETPDLKEARLAAARIVRDGRRAADTLKRVRAMFTRDARQRRPVNLNRLVRETAALLDAEAIRRHAVLRLDLSSPSPPVSALAIDIQQVMVNLITNALEAAGEGLAPRVVTIGTRRTDAGVEVWVADNGPGLPTDSARLFEPFFTTKPEGTGLGLSLSRTIVESHGGALRAEPNPGGGAKFTFRLPCRNTS